MADAPAREVELVAHGPPGSASGIGRYVTELHRHLAERLPVRVVRPIDPPLARRFSSLHHLPVGLRDHRPGSVVHFTQIMGCALMLWQPVRPAVATVHDLGPLVWTPEDEATPPLGRLLVRLSVLGLKRMDHIVAVSQATARSLAEHLGPGGERVTVVHEGVDLERFRPVPGAKEALEERYGIERRPGGFDLLYVGSEAPRKNLEALLEATARLVAAGHDLRLLKVGGAGPARYRAAFLDQIRRHGLEGRAVLVGEVPDDELPVFYSAADLLVLPSFVEGFGLPVLEAMACGTPVVCSKAGGLPEVVGDAALTFPPGQTEALAESISALVADAGLRRQMVRRGTARCREFTWQRAAAETEAVYRRIAQGKRGGARLGTH